MPHLQSYTYDQEQPISATSRNSEEQHLSLTYWACVVSFVLTVQPAYRASQSRRTYTLLLLVYRTVCMDTPIQQVPENLDQPCRMLPPDVVNQKEPYTQPGTRPGTRPAQAAAVRTRHATEDQGCRKRARQACVMWGACAGGRRARR